MKKVFLTVLLLTLCCSCTLLLNNNSGTISLAFPQPQLNRALPEDTKTDITAPTSYTVKLTAERGIYKRSKTFLPGQLIKIENIPVGNYELIVYGENDEFDFEGKQTINITRNEVTKINMTLQKYKKYLPLRLTLSPFDDGIDSNKYECTIFNNSNNEIIYRGLINSNNQIITTDNGDVRFKVGNTYNVEIIDIMSSPNGSEILVGASLFTVNRNSTEISVLLNKKYTAGGRNNPGNREYSTLQETINAIEQNSKSDSLKKYQILTAKREFNETNVTVNEPVNIKINTNAPDRTTAIGSESSFLIINNGAEVTIDNLNFSPSAVTTEDFIKVNNGKLTISNYQFLESIPAPNINAIYLGPNSILSLKYPATSFELPIYLSKGAAISPDTPDRISPPIQLKLAPDFDTSKPVMKLAPGSSLILDQQASFSITNSTGTKSYTLNYDGTVTEVL